MNGFYLIDKPLGITSFDVIRKLKKILWTSKIWHAWTLDPLASGLLLIAVWEYTKLLSSLLFHDKVYEFSICLDGKSESYDLGTPVEYISKEKQKEAQERILIPVIQTLIDSHFTGKILQVPPKYSALKVNGEKALLRAKSWEDFELKAREVDILSFKILEYTYPHILCRAHVSSGTYVRSLAYDIGTFLWTWGYIGSLRRTKLGKLSLSQAQTLEEFSPENMLQEENIFSSETFIDVDDTVLKRLTLWQRIRIDASFPQQIPLFISDISGIILICSYDGKILFPIRKLNT